ncbi:hypothetical protein [Streptomyces syringium]|uniref:hypothetical protein n=1 Tax=Streptomyces syringium TaxID=76729 RepID=UPI003454E04B
MDVRQTTTTTEEIDKDSSSAHEATSHHLEGFGAFWLSYPKKRDREAAKAAWIAALERGATPDRMLAAAQAYARERADEDPKYTKHPATWLNKGCYDDEPDTAAKSNHLRAVSGGYQPWRNPDDDSGYYDPL